MVSPHCDCFLKPILKHLPRLFSTPVNPKPPSLHPYLPDALLPLPMIGSYNRYLPTTALFPRILRQISSLYHVLPSPSPIPAVSTCSLLHLHNRTVVGS